jgi:hypothetical protein
MAGVYAELRGFALAHRACGLLDAFMMGRPAQPPMIGLNGKPGHRVPAHHPSSWRSRSRQCRVPDRLRAAGRPASQPPCPVPRPRRAHRLPAASWCFASGDRTGLAESGEAPTLLRPAHHADPGAARGPRALAAMSENRRGGLREPGGTPRRICSARRCWRSRTRVAVPAGGMSDPAAARSGRSARCPARRAWGAASPRSPRPTAAGTPGSSHSYT